MIKLSNEDARALAQLDGNRGRVYTTAGGAVYEVVENRDYEEKRWTMVMELVIRSEDTAMFRAFYERGLTENQWQHPFEYESELIDFDQVRPTPKTVIEYVVA